MPLLVYHKNTQKLLHLFKSLNIYLLSRILVNKINAFCLTLMKTKPPFIFNSPKTNEYQTAE